MINYNVENNLVREYLNNVNYADGYGHGTGDTKIKPYLTKIIQRMPDTIAAYNPNLTEQPKVYNLIPGSTIKVEGQLRMIHTNRCFNLRDIGGWKCNNGHIAYGKIIRGAEIGCLLDTTQYGVLEDIDTLTNEVGINVELDIRGTETYKVSPLGKNVKLYNGKSYGCSGYTSIFNKTTTKTILTTIINELSKGNTIFVHCAQGADRTGLVCMIIEALCGCSEDSIIKDWELTSFGNYLNTKYISDSINSTKKEAGLRDSLTTLQKNYKGSTVSERIYNYVKSIGITDTQINTLRSVLIVNDIDSSKEEQSNEKDIETKTETIVKTITIKDLDKINGVYKYQVTDENGKTTQYKSKTYVGIRGIGVYNKEDSTMITDYIYCKGYQTLEADYMFYAVAEYFDANKKAIAWEEVKADNGLQRSKFQIPSNAVYMRYQIVKHQGFTATLTKTETITTIIEQTKVFNPITFGVKDMIWSPFYISTGLGRTTNNESKNFKYYVLNKETFGHSISIEITTTDRQWSILRKLPTSVSQSVQVADGFEIAAGKAFTRFTGKSYGTDSVVIPNETTNGDTLYLFVWCSSDDEKTKITIK